MVTQSTHPLRDRVSARRLAVGSSAYAPIVAALLSLVLLWEMGSYLLARSGDPFAGSKLPPPHTILASLFTFSETILPNLWATTRASMVGLVTGTCVGVLAALVMSTSRWVEAAILPYVVAARMVPAIVLGPIIVAVVGNPPLAGVLLSGYISFFVIALVTLLGLRSVRREELELMSSLNASRRQVYLLLRAPATLPYLFTALKVAAPLSVVGAIVVELMGSSAGLGYLLVSANYYGEQSGHLLWTTVVVTMGLGFIYSRIPALLERIFASWQPELRGEEART